MNRVVFLTGASSGLGAALAALLAADGDRVALVARRADDLARVAETIRRAGGNALPIPCDVSDRASVHAAVRRCEAELGPVELLVANAGVVMPMPAEEFDADAVERAVRVNYLGTAYCIEAVLPGMIERRSGHVVGVSSLASYRGVPGQGPYSASKAALNQLLESLRPELEARGVRVTTILPGFVRSPMSDLSPYPMPFMLELDDAARRMHRAIRRRARRYTFPAPLAFLARISPLAPNAVFDLFMRRFRF